MSSFMRAGMSGKAKAAAVGLLAISKVPLSASVSLPSEASFSTSFSTGGGSASASSRISIADTWQSIPLPSIASRPTSTYAVEDFRTHDFFWQKAFISKSEGGDIFEAIAGLGEGHERKQVSLYEILC